MNRHYNTHVIIIVHVVGRCRSYHICLDLYAIHSNSLGVTQHTSLFGWVPISAWVCAYIYHYSPTHDGCLFIGILYCHTHCQLTCMYANTNKHRHAWNHFESCASALNCTVCVPLHWYFCILCCAVLSCYLVTVPASISVYWMWDSECSGRGQYTWERHIDYKWRE